MLPIDPGGQFDQAASAAWLGAKRRHKALRQELGGSQAAEPPGSTSLLVYMELPPFLSVALCERSTEPIGPKLYGLSPVICGPVRKP